MIYKILITLYNKTNPKDPDKFWFRAKIIVNIIVNAFGVISVLIIAYLFGKLPETIYAVIVAMLIRQGIGAHYNKWAECFISSIFVYSLYAVASLIINNLIVDLILGFALAVLMIDFENPKVQKVINRIKEAVS